MFKQQVSPPNANHIANSVEFRFLLDRCLAAHEAKRPNVADAYARAAEVLLRAEFPHVTNDIARAASKKGQGEVIGALLAQHLTPRSAACAALVLVLRGARKPVVNALTSAFEKHPEFNATIRTLCRRVFEPVQATPWISSVTSHVLFEAAAPHHR